MGYLFMGIQWDNELRLMAHLANHGLVKLKFIFFSSLIVIDYLVDDPPVIFSSVLPAPGLVTVPEGNSLVNMQ